MKPRPEDPVLRSARREALIVFGIWLAACVYTVGFCANFGYECDPASLTFVVGIPDWVFYGIFLPWTICTILSFIVSNFVIRDEDLGDEQAEQKLDGATDERRVGAAAKQGGNHA